MRIEKQDGLKLTGIVMLIAFVLALPTPALPQGGPPANGQTCCLATATEPLTTDEVKWLIFMREEEKLARDIYQQLYTKWNVRIFNNITHSEDRHFDAIGVLITRYNATDPAKSTFIGIYADQRLTALYSQLMAKGMTSLKDALEVGVLIEKQDIEDLETALKATSKTDIKTVYTNLLAGSLNHLDAFEQTLEVLGAN